VARSDDQRSQRSVGIPSVVEGREVKEEKRGWGRQQDDLCETLLCQGYTLGRLENIMAASLFPSVSLPACCHTSRHFLLSLNGFSQFLMTAQLLFMSQGPVTMTVNASSKAHLALH